MEEQEKAERILARLRGANPTFDGPGVYVVPQPHKHSGLPPERWRVGPFVRDPAVLGYRGTLGWSSVLTNLETGEKLKLERP